MKKTLLTISALLSFLVFSQMTFTKSATSVKVSNQTGDHKYGNFTLYYSFSGLGAFMGTLQPMFKVKGTSYVYTREQNSYYGSPDTKPEPVCQGSFRASSIDSILDLVKDIKDTLVYRTSPGITSGGIHHVVVKHEKINVTFKLHNATDPVAVKIVNILNSNIPADKEKLWLFD